MQAFKGSDIGMATFYGVAKEHVIRKSTRYGWVKPFVRAGIEYRH